MAQNFSSNEWTQLHREYDSTIVEKMALLQQLVREAENSPSLENLEALRQAVHKLAGNSGMYGYFEASSLCKQFEQEITQTIQEKRPFHQKEYVDKIIQSFQKQS